MGKVIAILAACVAVAGGASYAVLGPGHHCDRADVATCEVMAVRCCGESDTCTSPIVDSTSALAVAGPVAMFAPAKAESCSLGKLSTVSTHVCCESAPSDAGVVAVAGAAITMKK